MPGDGEEGGDASLQRRTSSDAPPCDRHPPRARPRIPRAPPFRSDHGDTMGIFDRFFPKKHPHDHHDHEHHDCPACGQHFHSKNELEYHKAKVHPKP